VNPKKERVGKSIINTSSLENTVTSHGQMQNLFKSPLMLCLHVESGLPLSSFHHYQRTAEGKNETTDQDFPHILIKLS